MCLAILLAALAVAQTAASTPVQAPGAPVALEEVVKLSKAGVSEEIIITKVKRANKAFDLTTDEILELKRAGVTDAVIKILMDPSQPYVPPPPPAKAQPAASTSETAPAAAAAPKKPLDPIVAKVPPEPGVYLDGGQEADTMQRLELKPLTAAKSPDKLSKMIMRKGAIGYLVGQSAKVRVNAANPSFLIRLPEKASLEEIILVELTLKKDRREINLGVDAAKPVFPVETVKQYNSEELDAKLFRIVPAPLPKGEFLFFLLGSGEEKKGILGKGYEFGIDP